MVSLCGGESSGVGLGIGLALQALTPFVDDALLLGALGSFRFANCLGESFDVAELTLGDYGGGFAATSGHECQCNEPHRTTVGKKLSDNNSTFML